MKEIINSPYKKLFLAGLLCHVFASWFSMGFHQMDEHFMILEFAQYRFGSVPSEMVPWEFTTQIRPTLQATFVYYVFSFLNIVGLSNPFIQVFLLRLLAAILAWYIGCKIVLRLAPELLAERVRFIWVAAVCLLWFMPYLQVRFSSENLAGISFLASLLVVPSVFRRGIIIESNWRWWLCGFLLASSFYFRFQMAFAIIGLLIWLLLYTQKAFKVFLFLLLGAIVAIGINLLVDRWFYGNWVLTPLRYFNANIVQDMASGYGRSPWYTYISEFFIEAIPPISIVLGILFFIGLFKKPMQLMVFIIVPFLIGHMAVAHKEFRFLFPMAIPFLFICFSGLQIVWHQIENRKWLLPAFRILVILNFLLLGYRCVWPAKTNHFYYQFLYNYAQQNPIKLITLGRGIYDEGHNEIFLYRPQFLKEDTMPEADFSAFINAQNADSLLVMSYTNTLPYSDPRYNQKLLYVYLPNWIMNIQLNDWQSRSDIWSLWLLRKKEH